MLPDAHPFGGMPSMSQVESTLCMFYSSTTSEAQRQQAHAWLIDLQQSKSAWKVSLQLLAESGELTAQLFGVNCLHTKLLKCWEDFSGDLRSISTLHEFLWARVYEGQYPILVRDRLASCLAILVLQTMPDVWENPVATLMEEGLKSDAYLQLSLHVLAAIPYNFRRIGMDLQRKSIVRAELRKQVGPLREYLVLKFPRIFSIGQSDLNLAESSINCLENWIEFESDLSDWSDLVTFCLSPHICTSVADDIFGPISRLFQNIASNIVLNQFENLALHLYHFLAAVLSSSLDQALQDEDLEICATLAKMASTLVENHAKFLLLMESSHPDAFCTVITGLLKLTLPRPQYPLLEQFSSLPLHAWFKIFEDLTTCTVFTKVVTHETHSSPEHATVMDECGRLKAVLKPYYLKLIEAALQYKLRLPDDFGTWSAADKENFVTYRREFSDVLVVVHRCYPIEYTNCLYPYLHVGQSASDSACADREVAFYALYSVAENTQDEKLLEPIFASMALTIFTSPAVSNSALKVVINYASVVVDCAWFSHVLPLVIRSLTVKQTLTEATLAFKELAESRDPRFFEACCRASQPESPTVLLKKLYSCVEDRSVEPADRLRALTCIGLTVSFFPPEEMGSILNQLVSAALDRLQAVGSGHVQAYTSRDALLEELDYIAALVGSINPLASSPDTPHPVYVIIQRCLPIFLSLFTVSERNSEVAEKMCHILQTSLTALAEANTIELCASYCQLASTLYSDPNRRDLPASAIVLPLVKKIFLCYGQTQAAVPLLRSLLDNVTENTVFFESTQNVDLYEHYLAMIQNICRRHPAIFANLDSSSVLPILKMCVEGLAFKESSVLKQASFCFGELFKTASSPSQLNSFMENFLSEHGAQMSHQVFDRLKTEPLVSCLEYLADVLFHMVKFFPHHLPLYLSALPDHHLVKAMMRETSNKRKFREFAKRINLAIRKDQIQL